MVQGPVVVVLQDSSHVGVKIPQGQSSRITVNLVLFCSEFDSRSDVSSTGHEKSLHFQYFLFFSESFIVSHFLRFLRPVGLRYTRRHNETWSFPCSLFFHHFNHTPDINYHNMLTRKGPKHSTIVSFDVLPTSS